MTRVFSSATVFFHTFFHIARRPTEAEASHACVRAGDGVWCDWPAVWR